MRILFLVALTLLLFQPNAHGKESEKALLKKAKTLSGTHPKISLKIAHQALDLSVKNKNHRISAQTLTLLGKTALNNGELELAKDYFIKASLTYKDIDDTKNYVLSSVDHINVLLKQKRHRLAQTIIDKTLVVANEGERDWPIGLVLYSKGENYYLQQDYEEAIEQYSKATEYFLYRDKKTQKKLAVTYKKLAQSYKRLKNREQTAYYYQQALATFTAIGDLKNVARTLNTLAESERYLNNLVVALDYSNQGLKVHEEINDPEGKAKALKGAGIIYRQIGRYEKSLTHLYQSHLYYKKVNDSNGIAETSNQLGFIYTRLKEYEQAKSFYQLTIDLSDKGIKQETLASALREMAVVHLHYNDYEAAMALVKKAYEIYKKQGDSLKSSITTRVIANIYRDQKQDDKALPYYEISLKLAKQSQDDIYQIRSMLPLANILMDINLEDATKMLEKALKLSKKIDDKVLTLYTYAKLRQAEKLRGNVAKSLYYAEQEIKLDKVIQAEKDKSELILAKANLHSHKMEIELDSLRERNRLDQLELAKKTNEIEIAKKTRTITELELTKNQYANFTLALLLGLSAVLVVFIYRRFIVSKKQNKKLDYLAARDPLTNCYNRRVLIQRLNEDFQDLNVLGEYCLIMADIDNFKTVNDTHGHNIGDSVICGVADIFQSKIGEHDTVARFGGEEFCFILNNTTAEQANLIAESMKQEIESTLFNGLLITCSFGITSVNYNAQSPSELISQADLALYKAKSLGRNKVVMWSDQL